jgi:serine/threonine protein kinase
VVEVVGNGSYGVVSKAQCKKTGGFVALKIMKNKPKMEYEIIKVVRELKLMVRLNKIN